MGSMVKFQVWLSIRRNNLELAVWGFFIAGTLNIKILMYSNDAVRAEVHYSANISSLLQLALKTTKMIG